MQAPHSLVASLIPYGVIFAAIVFRMRRMATAQPMRLPALWIRPALVCVIAGLVLYNAPPQSVLQALILVATLAAGGVLGWHQAKLMEITVDSATGTLQVKASLIATVAFFGVILLRMALRPWLTGADSPMHAYVGVVTDAFILFFVGFSCANATEMFIRGRALLSAAGPVAK